MVVEGQVPRRRLGLDTTNIERYKRAMSETLQSLVRSFAETHPEGAARALEGLDPCEAAGVLNSLPSEVVGRVAEHLMPHAAGAILAHFSVEQTKHLFEAMTLRQAAVFLQHIDEMRRREILASLPEDVSERLWTLTLYPPETAGGMMHPQVASLAIDLTTREAIDVLRRVPRQALYYLYVTDRSGVLVGVLNLRDLLLAAPHEPIEPKVKRNVTSVPVDMDREEVATLMRQRGFVALPVVSLEGRLLGVVKHDEVLDTVQEEAFEDLQKMVGAGGDESALSPVSTVVKRRLPWLCVNLLTAFLASGVVGLFESTIAKVTALAVFLPVVSGQGGNSGAQALAVVMRGLALKEILPGAGMRVVMKELIAGVLNGLAIALITGLTVGFWTRSVGMGLVIGLAMVVNMAVAALSGAAIPLVLEKMGRDPAQSSTIFLTTVTDIVGFAAFLGFAALMMPFLV